MARSGNERRRGRGNFKAIEQQPPLMEVNERNRASLEAIRLLQQVERDYIGRDMVRVKINNNGPIRLFLAGDLHLASLATDHGRIFELRDKILADPNSALVPMGDDIEGMVAKYLNTNSARTPLDFHKQIDWLRSDFVEPLANEGKVLAMVSGYWGHPGWAEDATTLNTWLMMTQGMDIPLLRNGGLLVVEFKNRSKQSIRIWHNPPGKSKYDPLYGLREAVIREPVSTRPNVGAGAHIHKTGVAREHYPGVSQAAVYTSSGTAKGSREDIPPDRFGVKLGQSLTDDAFPSVVMQARKRGQELRNYPTPSFEHGDMVHEALEILNSTESSGMTEELIEKIRVEVESKPKRKFMNRQSRRSTSAYESRKMSSKRGKERIKKSPFFRGPLVQPYSELIYDIQTKLPMILHLIAQARLGSSSEGLKSLQEYQADLIDPNPHALVLHLRSMIDKETGKSPDRKEVLDKFVDLIRSMGDKTLGVMMCGALRMSSWKTAKGKSINEAPIPPGTYIANEANVRLIHHLSTLGLAIGPSRNFKNKPKYTGAIADRLQHHGSQYRPTFGLGQIYRRYLHENPGFVTGGHMPASGTMYLQDRDNPETRHPILVGTGWWSKYYDSMGKGAAGVAAMPGQAIIFMPGRGPEDYMAFPTSDADETEYLYDALLLKKGLEVLGITDEVLKRRR